MPTWEYVIEIIDGRTIVCYSEDEFVRIRNCYGNAVKNNYARKLTDNSWKKITV